MRTPNAQYNLAAPRSLPARIAGHARRRMFARFLTLSGIDEADTLLDVGATSDRDYDHSNYVEAWYPHKARITAVGIDDAGFLTRHHPGLAFVRADGRALPFRDGAFDFVHSSAVLEHVGSAADQRRFLGELWRVCRRGLFVTTPNRWFPVEFHTVLPLVHWLPKAGFQALLRRMGHDFFADEAHLNLLGRADLGWLWDSLGVGPAQLGCIRLGGWPSNLILYAARPPAYPEAVAVMTPSPPTISSAPSA